MPYIKNEKRDLIHWFNGIEESIRIENIHNSGELNFALTILIRKYFKNNGKNYQAINDIIGALEGAKLEYYRTHVSKYEDEKITENGKIVD
jgi:hypothetical protein